MMMAPACVGVAAVAIAPRRLARRSEIPGK